eukprot:TRINITY_DN8643_c0_g1_i1.p1 TRINITY_DN8643_c0_g1~~TRINITY_DN8643_c0_g1_i1.p1  ORF type:complete len:859 (-),score=212.96 TRINITY_DN8643_c0_g1_i1:47-2461(-)
MEEDESHTSDEQYVDRSNLFGAAVPVKETIDVRSIEGKGHGDLPSFEDPSFDPVEYVNQKFSTEHSLSQLDAFTDLIDAEIVRLDGEVLSAVRRQSLSAKKAERDLQRSMRTIHELFEKVRAIKTKADRSEEMVQALCQDIKLLDYAKRNLTTTITTLRRLHMMIQAVDQLKDMTLDRRYRDAANLVQAVNELVAHFEPYSDVSHIREVQDAVNACRIKLERQVFRDFSEMALDDTSAIPDYMNDASLVIDALGEPIRKKMVSWFVSHNLEEYQALFAPDMEAASLAQADKRYIWCRKKIRNMIPVVDALFPPSWCVTQEFGVEFCLSTRQMLVDILDKAGESVDVAALMKLLQRTIDFERQMTSLLAHQTMHEESSFALDPKSPAAIRQKYSKEKKAQKENEVDPALARQTAYKYNGLISSCFEAYMSAYVEFEDRNLGDVVATALYHETWAADAGSTARILTCSADIFLAIKKSLDRCLAVTKGETLHDLTVVFKTHLFSLVDGFKERIPKPQPASTPKDMASRLQALRDLGSSDSEKREEVRMSDDDIRRVTYIINTSEYVFETLEQLSMLVRKKIDEHLQRQVDFVDVQDAFSEVITSAIRVLVMAIETRCEPAFIVMQKTNWMNITEVGDQSSYVETINEGIQSVVNICAPIMSLSYYRFFCDKLLSWFVPRFIAGILKIKKIGDQAGAQQLLFDTQVLKIAISRTPAKHPGLGQPHPGFVRMLNRDMGKAEGMVKVILSPVDTIVSSYRALVGGKSSDFFRLLEMKNIKKSEANALVEKYEALVKREKETETKASTMY